MSDFKEWAQLVLGEVKDLRHDIRDLKEEQVDQGKTLVRNTVTLEEHVKGSIATNRRLTLVEDKLVNLEESIKEEIVTLNTHIYKIDSFIKLITPTKEKIKWIAVILGILGGSYGGYQFTFVESPQTDKVIKLEKKPKKESLSIKNKDSSVQE